MAVRSFINYNLQSDTTNCIETKCPTVGFVIRALLTGSHNLAITFCSFVVSRMKCVWECVCVCGAAGEVRVDSGMI